MTRKHLHMSYTSLLLYSYKEGQDNWYGNRGVFPGAGKTVGECAGISARGRRTKGGTATQRKEGFEWATPPKNMREDERTPDVCQNDGSMRNSSSNGR